MKICTVEECGGKYWAKGLCKFHYYRKRNGTPFSREKYERGANKGCTVEGCERKHSARGLCEFHYQRVYALRPLEGPSTTGVDSGARSHARSELPDDIKDAYGF